MRTRSVTAADAACAATASSSASARSARRVRSVKNCRRARKIVPTTQAVPKMTNCTIASYGKGCPGSVIAHEMPPAVATSVPQRSHRARVW